MRSLQGTIKDQSSLSLSESGVADELVSKSMRKGLEFEGPSAAISRRQVLAVNPVLIT